MMETDGRDCATCQNPSRDMDGILKILMIIGQKSK